MPSNPALIIIRGNSASGKTRAAHEIRARHGYGLAIVSQDVLRRDILRQKDDPGNPAIGLIDLTARYALDHGYHVIVEGILFSQSDEMRDWYRERDLIPALNETIFGPDISLDDAVSVMMDAVGMQPQTGEDHS